MTNIGDLVSTPGSTFLAASGTLNQTVSIAGGSLHIQGGDVVRITIAYSNSGPSTVAATTPNAPNGAQLTLLGSNTTGGLTEKVYQFVATGSTGSTSTDDGGTIGWVNGATGPGTRIAITGRVHRGVNTTPDAFTITGETVAQAAHTMPTVTTTAANVDLDTFCSDKGSPPSTGFTPSAGITIGSSGIGTGTGQPSIGDGYLSSTNTAGSNGGGTLTGSISTATAIMCTIAYSPSGGTNYTPSVSDPIGITDTATATIGFTPVVNDAIGITDAVTRVVGAARTVSDPVGITDSASAALNSGIITYLTAGDSLSTGFTVVFKGTGLSTCGVDISTASNMAGAVQQGAGTAADADGFYRIVVAQASNTRYYYQAHDASLGAIGPIGTCKTSPVPGTPANLHVTFSACVQNNSTNGVALANAIARGADVLWFLGDQSYGGTQSLTRTVHEAQQLNQYTAVPHYLEFIRSNSLEELNSDHDAGPDNGDSNLTAAPYQQASIDAATHLYPEHHDDIRSPLVGRYRSKIWGRHRIIFADVRNTDRSSVTNSGSSGDTMFGATQLAWLKAELVKPQVSKIIVMDTPWMGAIDNSGGLPVKGDWMPAYDFERTDLMNFIAANQAAIGNLILVHGDAHLVGYATPSKNTWGGFTVLCAAGIDQVGGGRSTSTYTSFYNNGGGQVQMYGDLNITDDGMVMGFTFNGYDSSSGTDVARVTYSFSVSAPMITDPIGITDTVSAVQGAVRTVSDSVGITDTVTTTVGATPNIADPIGITDAATVKQDMARTVSDAVGITDAATVVQDMVRQISDAVGITDGVTATIGASPVVSDPVGITDAMTVTQDMVRQVSDPVGITDAATVVQDMARTVSDAVGITDSVTGTIQSGGFTPTITDPVGITDAVTMVQNTARTISDAVGITDAASAVVATSRTVSDAVGITDAVTALLTTGINYTVTINDGIGITDHVSVVTSGPSMFQGEIDIIAEDDNWFVSADPVGMR